MSVPGQDEEHPLLPDLQPLTAYPEEPADPGHLLPPEDWEQVQQQAQREAERIATGQPPPEAPERHGEGTGLAVPLAGVVVAPNHGPARGRPTFGVFHSMETPLRAGYAAALSRYAAGGSAEVSWHYSVDPAETWGVLPDEWVAWHVGNGNTRSLGVEQSGYARLSREEWLGPDGMAQHRRTAELVRHARDEYGIGMYLMTDGQLLAAHRGQAIGGWATHAQCSRVIGGSDHTDPGSGWPADVVLQLAAGQVPAPVPLPTPPPPPPRPPVPRWVVPAGQWLGNVLGPDAQHGGDLRWDSEAVHSLVRCVQQWLIFRGCVDGLPSSGWAAGWADGLWEGATDVAMATWHARYYPGQPYPAQCWEDDYEVLTR